MKALVKAKAERGIWLEDIPKPDIGHNDVLIKIKRTAICGTDIHIYQWDDWARKTIPVPIAIALSLTVAAKFVALPSAIGCRRRDT